MSALAALTALPRLPFPAWLGALAACAGYALALWAVDAYTPADVRHWQRLAALRGLDAGRDLGERVGQRLPLVRRLRDEVDIALLLRIGGSPQSADSWFAGTAGYALGAGAATAAADGITLLATGTLAVPLAVVPAVVLGMAAARYARLRRRASRRQAALGDQLADALLGLAILVPGVAADDALALLARCQREGQLKTVLGDDEVARIAGPGTEFRATRERLWRIGKAIRVPLFQELSLVMRGIDTEGLSPSEEYPALSRTSAEQRLTQNRMRAARAKTSAAAAIALLLVPLLMMVGGGIAFAFLGAGAG